MPAPAVDVYDGENALMGVLLGLDISKHRGKTVSFPTSIGLSVAMEMVYRSLKIEEGEERSGIYLREMLAEHRVPPDADRHKEHATFQIVYTWPVLQVTDVETSELLFDEPSFVPEGKPCAASVAESDWWRAREGGSGTRWFSGAITGDTIATGSISASKIGKLYPTDFGALDAGLFGTPSLAVPKVSKPKITVREADIEPDIAERMRRRIEKHIEKHMVGALRGLGKR